MTEKKGFLIYSEWCEAIKDLPPDQFKNLIMSLNEYSQTQKEPDIENPLLLALFRAFTPRMDIDRQNYEETCKKRAAAIKKRWGKDKETDTKEYKCIQKNTNVYKPIQTDTNDTDLELEQDLDLEQEQEQEQDFFLKKEKNKKEKTEKKSKKFIPPTVEEVKSYCQERNNGIDPQKFIDHYEANGWMRGKNKVQDWKACVRTWEGNNNNKAPPNQQPQICGMSQYFAEQKELHEKVIDITEETKGGGGIYELLGWSKHDDKK